ncbi:hypothetical protein K2173_019333 [Erythroxylum novogranatense]|uniref:inositol-1,3,4-trisphosphate 5/6-kinase n=1 Tax=Erythroxylum novogranatense TaxID=1862640 RepID=A0AAV8SUD9_9ROSI|nr:hypothetical protein K2173_019333 [Erythroxylum novogranatense]
MSGRMIRGVILDESVLLDDIESPSLCSYVPALLRKLRHSQLRLGISYSLSLSDDKVSLLTTTATQHSLSCFPFNDSFIDDVGKELSQAWGTFGGSVLYVASKSKNQERDQLRSLGWFVVVLDADSAGACENSSILCINKLEELPLTICHLQRKALGDNVVIVGYIMKSSREEDFAKRGAFPLCPTPNGLIFLPLTFNLPLQSQLQHVDVILHKATDEITSVELSRSSESNNITFTTGMQELQRFMECQHDHLVIDPLDNIYPVLDRLRIQEILHGLEDLNSETHHKIRGAHFLKVNDFRDPDLVQRLSKAKLSLPSIVKPQVACGVADAHSMAIIFKLEDYKDLSVPLPALVQEYVDHSSTLYKIYVLGEKIFYAIKNSTPNADILIKSSKCNGLRPLLFDSLRSLPVNYSGVGNSPKDGNHSFDLELVTTAANWLGRKLDLTIFGFDVVIQEGSGDHVIVDVNYLPSFKEVPDDVAIPAFWGAINQKLKSRKS